MERPADVTLKSPTFVIAERVSEGFSLNTFKYKVYSHQYFISCSVKY